AEHPIVTFLLLPDFGDVTGVSASGISALRLVDGAGSGIVRGGRISEGKKDGGGGGAEATSVMYASIGALSSVGTKFLGCLGLGMYTGT
ncbi:hypothetical protein Tco_0069953, partial [Tanacetum coccineum]